MEENLSSNNKKVSWTEEQLREAIKKSKSFKDLLFNLNLSSDYYNIINGQIKKLGLDISHFSYSSLELSNMLIENYPKSYSNSALRIRLIREGIKENKCERCGGDTWEGEPMPLQLHHVNGNHKDLRIENLQILCPNCHSLTDNYGGKGGGNRRGKKRKSVKIEKEDLIKAIKDLKGNVEKLIIHFDICETTLRRLIDFYNLNDLVISVKGTNSVDMKISKEKLLDKLKEFNWNYSKTGRFFGITNTSIRRLAFKFGLEDEINKHKNKPKNNPILITKEELEESIVNFNGNIAKISRQFDLSSKNR